MPPPPAPVKPGAAQVSRNGQDSRCSSRSANFPGTAQIGAFVAVCLCAAAGFWYFFVLDAQAELATRRTRLTSLRADVDAGHGHGAPAAGVRGAGHRAREPARRACRRCCRRRRTSPTSCAACRASRRSRTCRSSASRRSRRCSRRCTRRCRSRSRRRVVPQPRRLLRAGQQVPANHQHQQHLDQGQAAAGAERDDRRRMHRHDLRAAGRPRRRARPHVDDAQAAVARQVGKRPPMFKMLLATLIAVAAQAAARRAGPRRTGPPTQASRDCRPTTNAPAGYSYNPGRPPRSVREPGRPRQPIPRTSAAPGGIAGLLVDEVDGQGRHPRHRRLPRDGPGTRTTRPTSSAAAIASRTARSRRSRKDGVVFSQDVHDPLSLVKQREVPKRVRAADGRG